MPPAASRSGRRIASKACDSCRDRKVQCVFAADKTSCRKCLESNTECTFLKERKARGPPARKFTVALNLPVGDLSIEHFCSQSVFSSIIDDFLNVVYPLLPLIHRPSFRAALSSNLYTTDPAFFRLCIALCAVTIASIPRKFDQYGGSRYPDVAAMVDRACHLVLLSRVSSEPTWQHHPSRNGIIVSILLTMASHYAGRHNQGWSYASEAVQFFRSLELYRKTGYDDLNASDREMCKRAFWMLLIIQIHDRLSSIVPHTGLSYDPLYTDWEYLVPCEVEDEELADDAGILAEPDNERSNEPRRRLPVISGFIALTKLFICVVDILSNGYPGSPLRAYAMSSAHLSNSPDYQYGQQPATSHSTMSLSSLMHVIYSLQRALDDLPEELKITTIDGQLRSPAAHGDIPQIVANQFDIMRANIHITCLYLQSNILEACSGVFTRSLIDNTAMSPTRDVIPGQGPRTQLWKFRESIARELLEVLKFCSSMMLEANGASMVVKIREIAATLLDNDNELEASSELEEQSRRYVAQFADILANLDYMSQTAITPSTYQHTDRALSYSS